MLSWWMSTSNEYSEKVGRPPVTTSKPLTKNGKLS